MRRSDVPTRYHYTQGETDRMPIKRPPLNPASNKIECAEMSLRDADGDSYQPCEVCTHIACRYGFPCEICMLIVYARLLKNRTDNLDTRADTGRDAVQALRTDVDAHTASIGQHTTQIGNRPTNAQVNTAITNAVTPVDTKVTTLKNRVDAYTGDGPIP